VVHRALLPLRVLDLGGCGRTIRGMWSSPAPAAGHPRSLPAAALGAGLVAALLALAGCSDSALDADVTRNSPDPEMQQPQKAADSKPQAPTKAFDTAAPAANGGQDAAVHAEIAELARGKDAKDDEGQAAHDEAVSKLSRRGSAVELTVIDALRSDPDWNVRLGCLEVLQSIGTKACIVHLIAALQDAEPLISLHANVTLQALTSHREIPAADAPIGQNGLPPVPRPRADQLEMDTEIKIWTAWLGEHHEALHAAWDQWWKSNREHVTIE
jgi:hypothetical protein